MCVYLYVHVIHATEMGTTFCYSFHILYVCFVQLFLYVCCHLQVTGNVIMSFPLEVLSRSELPPLSFRIAGRSNEQVKINTELITSDNDLHTFNQSALLSSLKVRELSKCGTSQIAYLSYLITSYPPPHLLT